jgi:hypothetical protein
MTLSYKIEQIYLFYFMCLLVLVLFSKAELKGDNYYIKKKGIFVFHYINIKNMLCRYLFLFMMHLYYMNKKK